MEWSFWLGLAVGVVGGILFGIMLVACLLAGHNADRAFEDMVRAGNDLGVKYLTAEQTAAILHCRIEDLPEIRDKYLSYIPAKTESGYRYWTENVRDRIRSLQGNGTAQGLN